jgi:replication factor C subunit 2/4
VTRRYTKLTDEQVLKRLLQVCEAEGIPKTEKGLEALLFTAEGDMRHALNNLQATYAGESNMWERCAGFLRWLSRVSMDAVTPLGSRWGCCLLFPLSRSSAGFGMVSEENVFKVCDQPHPLTIRTIIKACVEGDIDTANASVTVLWREGYSASDIISTIFRVARAFPMPEPLLLEFVKVSVRG